MTMIDNQDLGERDNEEPSEFPPAERTVRTQAYDLSITTLKEQWDNKTLIIPEFQREYVWDNSKASRLIESLLLNIPIPILYFAETEDAEWEVVDGHQRIRSIVEYIDNRFRLSGLRIQEEFKGQRFFELPEREQRYLKTRMMRAIVIGADSHPTMKFEIFERLNTGGLALNAQEVRNAIYHGRFNNLLKDLESYEGFLACLGLSRPRKRMVDRELILRFFALRSELSKYRTPLIRFLNNYMRANRNPSDEWLEQQRELFVSTVDLIADVLGSNAFRVTDRRGNPTERNINRALFDAQTLAFSVASASDARAHSRRVIEELGALFEDEDFDDTIRRATGDRIRMLTRIRDVTSALVRAQVDISLEKLGPVRFPSA
jgi:hypothetical protein